MLTIFKPWLASRAGYDAVGSATPMAVSQVAPDNGMRDRFVTVPNPDYGHVAGAVSPYTIRLVREKVPKTFLAKFHVALQRDFEAFELNQFCRELDVADTFRAFQLNPSIKGAKAALLALTKFYSPDNAWFPAFAEITFDFAILAPALKNLVAALWGKPHQIFEVLPAEGIAKVAGFAAALSFLLTGVEGLPLIAQAPFREGLDELVRQDKIAKNSLMQTFLQKGFIGLGIRYGAENPQKVIGDYSRGDIKSWRNDFLLNLFIVPVMSVLMQWPGWVDTLPMAGVLSAVAATGSMRVTKLFGNRAGLAAFVRSGYFSTLNAFGALSAAGIVAKPEAYAIEIAVALGLFGALHLVKKN